MESSTISAKHQIVIPKNIRKKMGTRPGQKVYFKLENDTTLVVSSESEVAKAFGSLKGLWGDDPDKDLTELRAEWDNE